MGELFAEASILFTISRVKADVDNGTPPCMKRAKSTVARPSVKLFSSASSISKAASFQPRCSSIITAERIMEHGFTMSFPAILGAVP